jgi:hypothetical protein
VSAHRQPLQATLPLTGGTSSAGQPAFRLTLVLMPACSDGERALRRLLKFEKRTCRLRCTSVEPVERVQS